MSRLLTVSVGNPRMERKKYYSYEILSVICFVPSDESQKRHVIVRRRYTDFAEQHKIYVGLLPKPLKARFPAMPKKNYFGRFDQDTIRERSAAFQHIIDVAIRTPAIIASLHFQDFVGIRGLLRKRLLVEHMRELQGKPARQIARASPRRHALLLRGTLSDSSDEDDDSEEEEGEVVVVEGEGRVPLGPSGSLPPPSAIAAVQKRVALRRGHSLPYSRKGSRRSSLRRSKSSRHADLTGVDLDTHPAFVHRMQELEQKQNRREIHTFVRGCLQSVVLRAKHVDQLEEIKMAELHSLVQVAELRDAVRARESELERRIAELESEKLQWAAQQQRDLDEERKKQVEAEKLRLAGVSEDLFNERIKKKEAELQQKAEEERVARDNAADDRVESSLAEWRSKLDAEKAELDAKVEAREKDLQKQFDAFILSKNLWEIENTRMQHEKEKELEETKKKWRKQIDVEKAESDAKVQAREKELQKQFDAFVLSKNLWEEDNKRLQEKQATELEETKAKWRKKFDSDKAALEAKVEAREKELQKQFDAFIRSKKLSEEENKREQERQAKSLEEAKQQQQAEAESFLKKSMASVDQRLAASEEKNSRREDDLRKQFDAFTRTRAAWEEEKEQFRKEMRKKLSRELEARESQLEKEVEAFARTQCGFADQIKEIKEQAKKDAQKALQMEWEAVSKMRVELERQKKEAMSGLEGIEGLDDPIEDLDEYVKDN